MKIKTLECPVCKIFRPYSLETEISRINGYQLPINPNDVYIKFDCEHQFNFLTFKSGYCKGGDQGCQIKYL
jgi:hypothetical protein